MAVPKAVQRQVARGKLLQGLFESPDGRIALLWLMEKGDLLSAVHEDVPGLNDWNNGRRSLVLDLLKELRYDYSRLLELSRERVEEPTDQE